MRWMRRVEFASHTAELRNMRRAVTPSLCRIMGSSRTTDGRYESYHHHQSEFAGAAAGVYSDPIQEEESKGCGAGRGDAGRGENDVAAEAAAQARADAASARAAIVDAGSPQ